jgi:hypothetical protein
MHLTKKTGILSALGSFAMPFTALAGYGLEETAGQAGIGQGGSKTLPTYIGNIISAALGLLGVIFLILMVYGGYLWMTARGDETQTTKAKDTISRAIIGLVIVAGSYAIATYVVGALSK